MPSAPVLAMLSIEEWRRPLAAGLKVEVVPAEHQKCAASVLRLARFDDPVVEAGAGSWAVLARADGKDCNLLVSCFLCASLCRSKPSEVHHKNTFVEPRPLSKQISRMVSLHATSDDHKLAEKAYVKCASNEIATGAPQETSEAAACFEMLKREHRKIVLRWAHHAWVALRHYGRCLSSHDFVAALEDHRCLGSQVYAGIYDTKHFFKDIGVAGRRAVERFQKAELSQSPIKLNMCCVDEGKGFLVERVGYFKLVGEAIVVDTQVIMCKRVQGKDHTTFHAEIVKKNTAFGIEKLGVFLSDGCSVNGVKESCGTDNIYTCLKAEHPTMLGQWCANHILQLGAKAPSQRGSLALKEKIAAFDHFLNSVAASIAMAPDAKDKLAFFEKLVDEESDFYTNLVLHQIKWIAHHGPYRIMQEKWAGLLLFATDRATDAPGSQWREHKAFLLDVVNYLWAAASADILGMLYKCSSALQTYGSHRSHAAAALNELLASLRNYALSSAEQGCVIKNAFNVDKWPTLSKKYRIALGVVCVRFFVGRYFCFGSGFDGSSAIACRRVNNASTCYCRRSIKPAQTPHLTHSTTKGLRGLSQKRRTDTSALASTSGLP